MMRKLAAISIAFVYLFLSTGVLLNFHYCQGEIESVSVLLEASGCCCEGKMTDNKCCSNEQYFFHLDIDEQLVQNSPSVSEVFKYIDLFGQIKHDFEVATTEIQDYFCSDISPPPKLAIWKTNCSFLFYG